MGRLLVTANGPDDGPSVELGEHEVEHDQGGFVRLDGIERGGAVGGGHDREAVALEVGPHEPDDLGVVVDDEDRGGRDRRIGRRSVGGGHRQHGRGAMLGVGRVSPVTSPDPGLVLLEHPF